MPEYPKVPGPAARAKPVDLLPTIEILHREITTSLCEEVFQGVRTTERQREWSLHALAMFWVEVIVRAPPSLRMALLEAQGRAGTEGHLTVPVPATSFQAFSKRSQTLPPKFFAGVFHQVVERLLPQAPPTYNKDLLHLRKRFVDVLLVDGSKLDRIAHRLGITRKNRSVLLPGAIEVAYDLLRGIPRWLDFTVDAAEYELTRADRLLPNLAPHTLLVADRLYALLTFLREANERRLAVVTRPNNTVDLKVVRRLSSREFRGGQLEDYLVTAGEGGPAGPITLRWVYWKKKRTVREVITNVLDPEQLSAEDALQLYPRRWKIERMFFDLKEVLNLHEFYTDNPHGVAMQVHAAALVYAAMRVAQARVAQEHRIAPEQISVAKFFPRVAAASQAYITCEWFMVKTQRINKSVKVKFPRLSDAPMVRATLGSILVEERRSKRVRRRFCRSRSRWISFARIPGATKTIFLKN